MGQTALSDVTYSYENEWNVSLPNHGFAFSRRQVYNKHYVDHHLSAIRSWQLYLNPIITVVSGLQPKQQIYSCRHLADFVFLLEPNERELVIIISSIGR